MFSRLRVRRDAARSRSAQHDHARRRSYAAYDATDRWWWIVTDHRRLLAATHDHARDWRDGKACGGRAGWHEQVFGKRTMGWTIARCQAAGNLPKLTLAPVGQLPAHCLEAAAIPVGAGSPANTGAAGAIHCVGLFAAVRRLDKPAHRRFRQPSSFFKPAATMGSHLYWLIFHRPDSSECETQPAFTRFEDHR